MSFLFSKLLLRLTAVCIAVCFFVTNLIPVSYAQNQRSAFSHQPSAISFVPMLKGVKLDPANPLRLEFILQPSAISDQLSVKDQRFSESRELKAESLKLIKYFLAALTVPEEDLWVNLSPNEPDRIIADGFGQTEMGRDLLSQDYILKQLSSSLLHPDSEHGKIFWNKVYAKAFEMYGTTDIPVDTFHKVWIVPAKVDVYEKSHQPSAISPPDTAIGTGQLSAAESRELKAESLVAYVTEAKLEVMMEADYLDKQSTEDNRQ